MERRTLIVLFIILVIALGGFIESYKNHNSVELTKANTMRMSWKDMDVKPFAVNGEMNDRTTGRRLPRPQGFRLAKHAVGSGTYDTSEGHKVAEDIDKEKAKLEDKKKKKKKTSRGRKGKTMLADNLKTTTQKYPESKKSGVTETLVEESAPVAGAQPQQEESKEPRTFEAWAKLVLGSPRPDNVQALIDAYKSGQITADVFYDILNAMMEESKMQQELAVYAAGAVPETQSFIFLISVVKNRSVNSNIQSEAVERLQEYKTLANVGHLRGVYSVGFTDVTTVLFATQILNASTESYLETRAPSADPTAPSTEPLPGRGGGEENNQQTRQTNFNNYYKGFSAILERVLVTYGSERSIANPANAALTRLRNLTPQTVVADANGQ